MNNSLDIETHRLKGVAVHVFRNTRNQNNKRLLCIHGAGVAGRITFEYIIHYLETYDEVMVPDLPGMGDSDDTLISLPTINDYMSAIISILEHFHWQAFDLCGYSLGGLIAAKLIESNLEQQRFKIKQRTLIEPALFDDPDIDITRDFRKHYKDIANDMLNGGDADENILRFLDLVSPNRTKNPRADKLAITRLGRRPKGFAQALHAVATESDYIDRERLIKSIQPVTVIAGQNSYPRMLDFHDRLHKHHATWDFVLVPSCDHSIPYQKPRRIAEILDSQ